MLDLDSPRWKELNAAVDVHYVPERIRQLAKDPTNELWIEIWENIAHQWTLYTAAYAALPHLLALGMAQGIVSQPTFLLNLGRVAAPRERVKPVPEDLKAEFDEALKTVAPFALRAAESRGCRPDPHATGFSGFPVCRVCACTHAESIE